MTSSPQESPKAMVTKPTGRTIHIERDFNASRDRVWEAFTDPTLVAQWWGRGNKLDIEQFDLQPGGRWRFVENSAEGVFAFSGEFREITPKDRIVQTFGWDGMPGHVIIDTATFVDLGDNRTRVVADSMFETEEERDGMLAFGMEAGLNESYAALDRLLASG